ncbi:hypothetical protein HNQ94_001059 [Salirhabdus euzebyi]|uniref:Uncharacterized protein n=1 Tax=Salirhabdus euzebyi TaxID=394506 RepID=A0A841Q230_9BACI|nr:hypothetical protein [Salirhabdus euzebyi]MBB6452613.1 hypothetical protein [Salirhabdus euzebyi]
MVIQSNMSPKAIVGVWRETEIILNQHKVPLIDLALRELVENELLPSLLQHLNEVVGSSSETCIEGG